MKLELLTYFLLACLLKRTLCEGILWEPPSRMSAWRINSTAFPIFYSDKVISCIELTCSICGGEKKLFEKGSEYYRGYIVKSYTASIIHVDIQVFVWKKIIFIVSNHKINNS